jgi:AAA+ superfamily predicted ATPase
VQDDVTRTRLTLQTIGKLLGGPAGIASAAGQDAALRRASLVTISEDGPWAQHTLSVEPGVIWALVGDDALDPALDAHAVLIEADDPAGFPFVVVTGSDRIRRQQEAALRTTGDRFLSSRQPTDDVGWSALVREATLSGLGIMLEVEDALTPAGRRWIERADHLSWAVLSRHDLALDELPRRPRLEFQAPDHETTTDEWERAFGVDIERSHHLRPEQLESVSNAFRARQGDLDAAVRRLVAGRLERLARRIRPRHTWDDIILSPDRLDQLRGIVARYRHSEKVYDDWGFRAIPSRGLVALFSGPSGTGKTLAAEILAGALGLDVFKLDLSAVVSKYIGETEKNLEQIFEAAGAGNVVLFFDEADSLFGKRSEVKDARDRYANIEVSYLLQRLEAYDGIVILATNFEKNVDDAFLRRIHERIDFIVPGPDEREAIWRRNLPTTAPVDELDLVWLARRFEMSGGQIRNAVIHAAFLAASDGSNLTMTAAVRGVARELRKGGRLLKPSDFGQYHALVSKE